VVDKPAEILLFDFLTDAIAAAAADSVLAELELHDTVWQQITRPRGVRISDAVGDLAPGPGGDIEEFDVMVIVTCFSRIGGKSEKKERQPALIDVFGIQKAIAQVLRNDSSLGGRVCDSLLQKGGRGYDKYNEGTFAVTNTPLIINPRELGR
jgi:hypothetical protein